MPRSIIIDSGPCIALFNRDDKYHQQALEFMKQSKAEFLSTLTVVTEAMYVLDFNFHAQMDFLKWVSRGALNLVEAESEDFVRVCELMEKYADLPMDFTEGLLVALCERLGIRDVASIDNDFSIYRFKGKSKFKNHFLTN